MSYPAWPNWTEEQWREAVQPIAKREYVREPAGTSEGGQFASVTAPVLKGVDFKANAEREVKKWTDHWEKHFDGRVSREEVIDRAKDMEKELRDLPLVHGTTVAGAVAAATEGLKSYAEIKKDTTKFEQELKDLDDELTEMAGESLRSPAFEKAHGMVGPFAGNWDADDLKLHFGLDRQTAEDIYDKIQEIRDLQKVMSGTTFHADEKLGLDQFVFMTHGAKHQDYGSVGVIIDNEVVQDSWATERDIMTVPGAQVGNVVDTWEQYNPETVKEYQQAIVKGEDYYRVAAAKGGDLPTRTRDNLFEIKAPRVPKSAVKGFVVEQNLEEAQRLADELASKGITNKVLYMGEVYGEGRKFLLDQMKAMQTTGDWDHDAYEAFREKHDGLGVYIL